MFFLQMSGFPGSGKSTLGRLIAKHTNAIVIDHDIDEINTRLKKRRRMISQIEHVSSEESFKNAINNSKVPSDVKWIRVNTAQSIDNYIDQVIVYINE